MRLPCSLWAVGAVVGVCTAWGAFGSQPDPSTEHARARFVSERSALIPGTRAWLGIAFDIDPGWHLYWDGLNDTGMPIDVQAALPADFIAGEIQWPAPRRLVLPGDLVDHVYERRVTLLLPVDVPFDARPGSRATFKASVEWLVCREACIPGEATLELTLPIETASPDGALPAISTDAALIEEARQRIPQPVAAAGLDLTIKLDGDELVIKSNQAKALAFYPGTESDDLVDRVKAPQSPSDTLRMRFLPPKPSGRHIEGVLEVTRQDGGGSSIYAIELPPAPQEPGQPEGPAASPDR